MGRRRCCCGGTGCFACTGTLNLDTLTLSGAPDYTDADGYNPSCLGCATEDAVVTLVPAIMTGNLNSGDPFGECPTIVDDYDERCVTKRNVTLATCIILERFVSSFPSSYIEIVSHTYSVQLCFQSYRLGSVYKVDVSIAYIWNAEHTKAYVSGGFEIVKSVTVVREYRDSWEVESCADLCGEREYPLVDSRGSLVEGLTITDFTPDTDSVYCATIGGFTLCEPCLYATSIFADLGGCE